MGIKSTLVVPAVVAGGNGGGKIDENRIIIKSETIPVASEETYKKIYIFSGETNSSYTHGYIYECKADVDYDPIIDFPSAKIGFDYTQGDLVTFFEDLITQTSATCQITDIVKGNLIHIVDDVWKIQARDANNTLLFEYQQYQQDFINAGFVFLYPSYADGEDLTYSIAYHESLSNIRWERINVQPAGSGAGTQWGDITGTLSQQTDLQSALNNKQATLVSGTNIKTINNNSILGSGNIDIQGGSGTDYTAGTGISIQNINVVKVVSGFDGYKTIQLVNTNPAYPKPTSSFEFVTRVKQTSAYNSAILGNGNDDPSGGGIFMRTTDSDPLVLHCWGTYSNSNFDIDNFDTGVEFALNTWVWVKCTWDGSDYMWYQKADSDTLWTQCNSLTSVACSAPYITQIGATGNNTSWYWHGSIDITNTYIKVDDTIVFDGADSTQWTATGLTVAEEQGPGASVETQIAIANPFVAYIQDGAVAKMNLQTVVDASGLASNTGAVHALDLDLSENKKLTKLTAKGTSGNLVNLSDVLVSNYAPFNNVTSPQIDVSYSNLSKNALVNLFNSLPYNSGYTVVGSITVSSGVASGFSEGNGLQIADFPAASADWEIVVKADTTFNDAQQRLISCGGMYLRVIGADNYWNLYVAGGTEAWADSANTYPYIKIRKKGSYIDLFQSSDGVVYTLKESNISIGTVTDDNLDIGNSSAYWNGNFYLNESSITVNGLPYFNGQMFMTKTCNIVGCTGTASLEQTDKDIALDKGWSLTVA